MPEAVLVESKDGRVLRGNVKIVNVQIIRIQRLDILPMPWIDSLNDPQSLQVDQLYKARHRVPGIDGQFL